MGEQWGASTCDVKEITGVMSLYAMRITNCQNADTITLPVGKVVAAVASNETSAGVTLAAVSSNVITITCTNNDEVNVIAICEK